MEKITIQKTCSLLILLLCLLFYKQSVCTSTLEKTGLIEFFPGPDVVEYQNLTKKIIEGKKPTITIAGEELPSRYSIGWPLIASIIGHTLPKDKIQEAPFLTNKILGATILLVSFLVFYQRKQYVFASCLSLLITSLPCFLAFSRSAMSEITAAGFLLTIILLLEKGGKKQQVLYIYGGAFLLGLSLLLRSQLLFFSPCLLAALSIKENKIRHLLITGSVFLSACLPMFLANWWILGSPTKTGYAFWVDDFNTPSLIFNLHNIPLNIHALWKEITMSETNGKSVCMSGTCNYITITFLLLGLLGLRKINYTPTRLAICLGALTLFISNLTYFWAEDTRLYFPLYFLLALSAAYAASLAIGEIKKEKRKCILTYITLLLFGASILGIPSSQLPLRPSLNPNTITELNWGKVTRRALNYLSIKTLLQTEPHDFLVLSDINPVYLSFFLPKGSIAAPIDEKNAYNLSKNWKFDSKDAKNLVITALKGNVGGNGGGKKEVYILQSPWCNQRNIDRFPKIQDKQWKFLGSIPTCNTLVWKIE